ncbi:MAG: NADH-quinone oxidoreductase subunit J [Bdellovibrionales bacterium]|nr:NADH-quinone oxidoreductase subunit J [Bdellovibrionales bacterium]
MMENSLLFYVLSTLIVLFSFGMLVAANPVFSALFLALTMVGLAGLFFHLEAYFIAGVQLIVYAGAVMVLFVMVLMLFDLKKEIAPFSRGTLAGFVKLVCAGALFGLIIGAAKHSTEMMMITPEQAASQSGYAVEMKALATLLFTKYLLAFEVLGVLLLLIAVGVVAVSRAKGGTHVRS